LILNEGEKPMHWLSNLILIFAPLLIEHFHF
jgi:hypothetical protein